MRYPSYKTYDILYAKYINPQNLLDMMDLIENYTDKTFVDICCGKGMATQQALLRGAKHCIMIDKEREMIPDVFFKNKDITVINESVQHALYNFWQQNTKPNFDIVFCRQAINYWFYPMNVNMLSDIMKKGDILIFNTFNTKPPKKPLIKEYVFDNSNFVEISYSDGNVIDHVQIREGYEPHITHFEWISSEMFDLFLSPTFEIEKKTKGKTDVYKCIRK